MFGETAKKRKERVAFREVEATTRPRQKDKPATMANNDTVDLTVVGLPVDVVSHDRIIQAVADAAAAAEKAALDAQDAQDLQQGQDAQDLQELQAQLAKKPMGLQEKDVETEGRRGALENFQATEASKAFDCGVVSINIVKDQKVETTSLPVAKSSTCVTPDETTKEAKQVDDDDSVHIESAPAAPEATSAFPAPPSPKSSESDAPRLSLHDLGESSEVASDEHMNAGGKKASLRPDPKPIRGRQRQRATINRRRSSSSFSMSNNVSRSTPSYLRATRSSSESRELALKRKHDRLSLSSSQIKKTGFGGHTYKPINSGKRLKKGTSHQLTEPKAFRLSTGGRKRQSLSLSTEERELEEMKRAREVEQKRRKLNMSRMKRALSGASTTKEENSKITTSLTEAKPFNISNRTEVSKECLLSSEEREMQKIQREKAEAKRLAERNKKTMERAIRGASSSSMVKNASEKKQLTEAVSPNLSTSTRPKAKAKAKIPIKRAKSTHGMRLRTTNKRLTKTSGPVKATRINMQRLTRPMTPEFATSKRVNNRKEKRVKVSGRETYQPLAEQVMKLTSRVPDRFHSKPKNYSVPSSSSNFVPELTEPKAPSFASDLRAASRPAVKSTEERELELIQKYNKNPFKANPVNKRIMNSSGDMGVPRLAKKPLTKCESPKFQLTARAQISRRSVALEERKKLEAELGSKQFKARSIGEGVPQDRPCRSCEPKALTEFKPFNLSTSQRRKSHSQHSAVSEELKSKPFKARPIPVSTDNYTAPQAKAAPVLTKPLTPKLEGLRRHKAALKAREEKAAEIRMAEKALANSFRARNIGEGVPEPPRTSQGAYEPKPLTEPVPFKISNDPIGSKARREQRLKREQIEAEEARKFRARPIPRTHVKPFCAEKKPKALTEVKNVILQSDKRAMQRAAFEKDAAARRAQAEKAKLEAQLAEEAEANALIDAELAAVQFKARDIGEGVPVETPRVVQVKELCVPQSPKLLTKSRIRASFGGQH